jgi:uncharacterized sulfatase
MYDNSLRVPTAVVWPGVIRPGTRITETVSHLDWYPTLVELAGGKLPQGETIRGRSIVPLLKGEAKNWDNDLYAEYSTHHQSRTDMRVYRTPEWKLIRDFLDRGRDELYDLRNDPEERKNLIASKDPKVQAVVRELHAKLLAKMRESHDPVLRWSD